MFKTSVLLPFRLLGIPIRLDITFLLVLAFFTWVIGSQIDAYIRLLNLPVDPDPLTQGVTPYLLGLVAGLGLLLCVLLHELGHAVTARLYDVEVKEITLWILGGIAHFENMPRQKGGEAVVAIAGPITSLMLGGLFYLGWQLAPATAPAARFTMSYLSWANVALALFNLLPALPMDGGRVLRSLLALRLGDLAATRIAAGVSQVLAVLLGLFGLLTLQLFLVLIAFFIFTAVQGETQYAVVTKALQGIRVGDIMTREVVSVPPDMRMDELIALMFSQKHLGYPVLNDGGDLVGFVKLQQAQASASGGRVADIMTREVPTVSPQTSALDALRLINENEPGRLVVVDRLGTMVGILSKTDLMRIIQIRLVGENIGPRGGASVG